MKTTTPSESSNVRSFMQLILRMVFLQQFILSTTTTTRALLLQPTVTTTAAAAGAAAFTTTVSSGSRRRNINNMSSSATAGDGSESKKALVVDPFCFRQFSEKEASKTYGGAVFTNTITEFEDIVNQRYSSEKLQEGYAPFCKHLFIENDFTNARVSVLKITPQNEHLLRSNYEARNDKELPVLTRYFPKDLVGDDDGLPVAKYLDLILYSREQINKENESMGKEKDPETAPWGIVSIKAQDVDYELPMTPITAMRNALGKDQGGSGVPLDKQKYMEAVQYWKDHANIS